MRLLNNFKYSKFPVPVSNIVNKFSFLNNNKSTANSLFKENSSPNYIVNKFPVPVSQTVLVVSQDQKPVRQILVHLAQTWCRIPLS
jgi:hypothetical protein